MCWDQCCHIHRRDTALSGRVFTVGHCSIPPYSEAVLHCTVHTTGSRLMPSSWLLEGLTVLAENTGLVVGRTLVDPSRWRVPVLVSNFSQDTAMVEPFSEVGMVAQVSAIQSVTETMDRSPCGVESLPRTFMIFWMTCNKANWQSSNFAILICSLYPDQHWPVTPTRWTMRSIREMGRLLAVHPAGCHLRR